MWMRDVLEVSVSHKRPDERQRPFTPALTKPTTDQRRTEPYEIAKEELRKIQTRGISDSELGDLGELGERYSS
jgi:hypothetical protein